VGWRQAIVWRHNRQIYRLKDEWAAHQCTAQGPRVTLSATMAQA
jgi:hypothetical protein